MTIPKTIPEDLEAQLSKEYNQIEGSTTICIYNFEGSNFAADAVSAYVYSNSDLQIHTIVDKSVPEWIGPDVDVILMSYAGSNRYIESIYNGVKTRGSRIHCITSGGLLAEFCILNGDDLHLVPDGLSPFEATGFEMGALVNIYDSLGVKGLKNTIKGMIPKLKEYRDEIWKSDYIWKLAMKVNGAIPVIYSSGEMRAVHKRWKILLNSATGKLAFSGELPEFDHNEIVSWTEDSDSKEFIILIIQSESDSLLLNKIFNSVTSILFEYNLQLEVIKIEGELVERSIRGIMLADAVIAHLTEEG